MIVYRLSKQAYCNDLSGSGAEKTGGRWNSKGIPMLYTASSRALAMVEIAVHVPLGIIPLNYYITTIEILTEESLLKAVINDFPAGWNKSPFTKATQYIGDDFIRQGKHLMMQVPSVTVPGDHNYLINPRHPLFNQVQIISTEPFEFDLRLFKKPN
jgi:RES domain-containing protein